MQTALSNCGCVLEFLKVFLSWPVVVLVLGLVFMLTFKAGISSFLNRLIRGEAYGVRVEATSPAEQRKEAQEQKPIPTQDQLEQYVAQNPKQVITEYRKVLNGYWFERGYNLIYGSQIRLLEHLLSKGDVGEKYVNLLPFHNEFVRLTNLQATQFADYLGFLRDMQFIEYTTVSNELIVKITPFGVDFVSYIKGQYPSYNMKPF